MEYIRLLHPRNFDHERGRFNELSFKVKQTGVSVLQRTCVVERSELECSHIREYYPFVTGEPPVFWVFDEGILPDNYLIEQSVMENNDECHYEIRNVSNGRLWKFFKQHSWREFVICDNGDYRPLSQADVDSFN